MNVQTKPRGIGVLVAAAVVFQASIAINQTSDNKAIDAELKKLSASPKALDAEAPVIRIFEMWDAAGPKRVIDALTRISGMKGASLRARERAEYFLSLAKLRRGDVEGAEGDFTRRGFLRRWITTGPFGNEGGVGLDTAYPPEDEMSKKALSIGRPQKKVTWRAVPEEAVHLGYVALEALHEPITNTCFYARTSLDARKAGAGVLKIGSGGAFKAFWNGREALDDEKYRSSDPDRLAATVDVKKGMNHLLLKVCTEERGDFGFYARVTDKTGAPWPLEAAADPLKAMTLPVPASAAARPFPQPMEKLVEKARKGTKSAAAQASAAEYLLLTYSADLDSHEARDMAKRACELSPGKGNCTLWSELSLDRNEARFALQKARDAAPEDPGILMKLAKWEMSGPEPARALPLLKAVLEKQPDNLEAKILEIDVASRRGFPSRAFKAAEALMKAHPGIPMLIDFAASLAGSAGRTAAVYPLTEASLAHNFDDVESHELLARAAFARGDKDAALRHLDHLTAVAPSDSTTYRYVANLMEGAGELRRAEAAHLKRTGLAPGSADAWKELGLFLMRIGRRANGITALQRALAIMPQDAWLTEYLAHLGSLQRYEEPFIVPQEIFLAMRTGAEERVESRYLVDQEVVRVYESGLSSSFTQTVFEIGNRDDAKAWRTRFIQFSSTSQRVKVLVARVFHPDGTIEEVARRGVVPVSEPWYRLYYDVSAEVLEFPKLSEGDVVEFRYRVEDTSSRNMFDDYFGDFVFIEDIHPKGLWRYALIAPKQREFQFNKPKFKDLEHRVEEDGDTLQYTFESQNVPGIIREGDMPGLSEIAAYLHVSTYKSWAELGRWYQGLVRHQMVPDERIRRQVATLIKGKRTRLEKVQAIYDWVVTATRYVGLEFGIHGYKPYRAPLVVSRGFGDCKDKASLLVTMLTEAGIEAEFVLIRTSDLGRLAPDPPSLSVFNHAIIHVPSLNLWLDGTAEHHGVFELPFPDQAATVVVLGKDGARFTTTPTAPADRNALALETRVTLDPDGDADLKSGAVVKGRSAAQLRQLLEAPGTQRERFEASLAASYPGAQLKDLELSDLTDLTQPLKYEFTAFIPAYGTKKDGLLEVPVDDGLDLTAQYARLPVRSHDLVLGPKALLEREMTLEIPDGFEVAELPSSTNIFTKFGKLEFSVKQEKGTIRISRRFELMVHRVTATDYQDFVEFCRKVDSTLGGQISLRRSK